MALFILGVNYRTAPLAVRERVVFHAEELRRALGDLAGGGRMPEAAILSTCNRTEVYGQGGEPEAAARWLTE
ncbi:MAG: glutamyl-tRNA reductase, partial [Candidatus Accumulibacter sp.]|nr:glutamyl-tRNA reductase [Accumulibacter sp.]